jgi:hypothetical protein
MRGSARSLAVVIMSRRNYLSGPGAGEAGVDPRARCAAARTGNAGPRDGKTVPYLVRGAFWRTVLVLGMRRVTKIIPIQEVSGFSGGDVLDGPGSPRVVHAPGHTDGSVLGQVTANRLWSVCWSLLLFVAVRYRLLDG